MEEGDSVEPGMVGGEGMVGLSVALGDDDIAQMLGTRRSRVSEAAVILQGRGLIRYSRGHITILNREGLEEFTCECYAVVQAEFERLLGK